ncbi:MAG: ribonuclease III [Rhodospirillales bacterium]
MSAQRDDERARLAEELLGYRFARADLLREALTHRSAAGGRARRRDQNSNERLEFIGDRVLGLLIAEWLAERFPNEQEGQLGPRLADLVSRDALAHVAQTIGFSRVLSLGDNEALAGVASLANVLADGVEAALGAVYLDGGLEAARRFVRRAWSAAMDVHKLPPKDPKTNLQEKLLGKGLPLPVYEVVSATGPSHAPVFVVRVSGSGQAATGEAGSKRAAERIAAAALLEKLA